MSMLMTTKKISVRFPFFLCNQTDISLIDIIIIQNRYFLPFGRADLAASPLSQPGLGWVGSR